MARRLVRPFGASIPTTRVFSLLLALVVLGLMFDTVRKPATWKWLADANTGPPTVAATPELSEVKPPPEALIEGPNDLDSDEMALFRRHEELVTDRSELRPREMVPYWQLMKWSRSQPFADLERRASREPAFVQLWDRPAKYRGQPIRLRMHVRRVLEFDAPENPTGANVVYEAWGWTDESKSFPYVVVFTEKPKGLPVGPDVAAEVVFVGYFLKLLSYTAFDARRGAPLLVGKLRLVNPGPQTASPAAQIMDLWILIGLAATLLTGAGLWYVLTRRRPRLVSAIPATVSDFTLPPDFGTSSISAPHDNDRPFALDVFQGPSHPKP